MMKHLLLSFLSLSFLCLSAQKTDENYVPAQYRSAFCRSSFAKIKLEGENNAENIRAYLKKEYLNLKGESVGLKLNYVNESPGALHYSFTQTFKDIEVYQSEVKVNIDRHNIIRSVFDNSENTADWNFDLNGAGKNSVIAIHPKTHLPVLAEKKIENGIIEILEVNGEIIFVRDLRSYYSAPDSLVSGKIFNPDPLTSAGHIYDTTTIYRDRNDNNAPWLDAQLQTVSFMAKFDPVDSLFKLESPFVHITEIQDPVNPPPTSTIPQFNYNRSDSNFEDVNAFYHISKMHEHIQSLGFTSADALVNADGRAGFGDQSFFVPGTPLMLKYGIGGVDDAEDADVIVHEYGHSISYTSAPGSNSGGERQALDEAFGDYLAASYSKSISTYHEEWTFNWDGHNEYWRGRIANTPKIYPDSMGSSIYHNGEIWVAALCCLNSEIGRDATDSLILQTHYSYATGITIRDAYFLMVDADTLLTGGRYYCPIYKCMHDHGIAPFDSTNSCVSSDVQNITESDFQFFQNGMSFTLFQPGQEQFELRILDLNGRVIDAVKDNEAVFNYRNDLVSSGIYLVLIQTKTAAATFKWCKVK